MRLLTLVMLRNKEQVVGMKWREAMFQICHIRTEHTHTPQACALTFSSLAFAFSSLAFAFSGAAALQSPISVHTRVGSCTRDNRSIHYMLVNTEHTYRFLEQEGPDSWEVGIHQASALQLEYSVIWYQEFAQKYIHINKCIYKIPDGWEVGIHQACALQLEYITQARARAHAHTHTLTHTGSPRKQ